MRFIRQYRRADRFFRGALAVLLLVSHGPAGATEDAAPSLSERIERLVELPAQQRLAVVKSAPGTMLAPFATDGCSGGQSAGWTLLARQLPAFAERLGDRPPWEDCCVIHDRAYHAAAGDTAEAGFRARRTADQALRACVLADGERRKPALMAEFGVPPAAVDILYAGIAEAMYHAVRLGGAPCSPLPWRWGYGWPSCG